MAFTLLGAAAIVKDDKILLLQQTPEGDQANLWGPPAGHGEKGETLVQTAVRETKEESGLDVKILGLVQAGFAEYQGLNYILAVYKAEIKGSDQIKLQKEEAANYVWASLEDLKTGKYPCAKSF